MLGVITTGGKDGVWQAGDKRTIYFFKGSDLLDSTKNAIPTEGNPDIGLQSTKSDTPILDVVAIQNGITCFWGGGYIGKTADGADQFSYTTPPISWDFTQRIIRSVNDLIILIILTRRR